MMDILLLRAWTTVRTNVFFWIMLAITPVLIHSTEPNVFFVTDDTPAGHHLGRIAHFNDQQSPPLDADNSRAVLVRANRPPASYFSVDENKGDLYTKIVMDREMLCVDKPANVDHTNYPLPSTREHWSSSLSKHRQDPVNECEFIFQIALNHKTNAESVAMRLPDFIDIRVVIVDRNDHIPTFSPQKYVNISVPESASIGTRVRLPLAIDPDSSEFGIKKYQLYPKDVTEWSLYQQSTDVVFQGNLHLEIIGLFLELRTVLDRERQNSYVFDVRAFDSQNELSMSSFDGRNTLKVYLVVDDINDNGPVFRASDATHELDSNVATDSTGGSNTPVLYKADVTETIWSKAPILRVTAYDIDGPMYSSVRYDFAPYVDSDVRQLFKINEHTGDLYLRQPLDYESKSSYTFHVLAIDAEHDRRTKVDGTRFDSISDGMHSDIYTATAQVLINVRDINDESPVIELDYLRKDDLTGRSATYAAIQENAEPPQFVADLLITDRDVNPNNNHVTCNIFQEDARNPLAQSTRKSDEQFQLTEIRRHPGQVQYNILAIQALDRESLISGGSVCRIRVLCSDSGEPVRSSQTTIVIHIVDINDNEPIIHILQPTVITKNHQRVSANVPDNNSVFLYENTPIGTHVLRVNVTDSDLGANGRITCTFDHATGNTGNKHLEYFHIDPSSCDIITKKIIDRETADTPIRKIVLPIKATDYGIPPKVARATVDVIILDENDNAPQLAQSYYRFNVKENAPAGTSVGILTIVDLDEMSEQLNVRFQKLEGLPFILWSERTASPNATSWNLVSQNTYVYHINTTKLLDRETQESYEFKVLISDTQSVRETVTGHTTTVTIFVLVEDVNDNDPVIIFPQQSNKTFHLSNSERRHYQLMTVNANDRDMLNDHFVFSLMDESEYLSDDTNKTNTSNTAVDIKDQNLVIKQPSFVNTSSLSAFTSFLQIDQRLGTVFLSRDMSSEDTGVHAYYVIVKDTDSPPRSAQLRFLVKVEQTLPRSYYPKPTYETLTNIQRDFDGPSLPSSRDTDAHQALSAANSDDSIVAAVRELEIRLPTPRPPLLRFTGDVVLILSLGMILLLLLATLFLVIYARRWSHIRRLPANNQAGVYTSWLCEQFCDTHRDNEHSHQTQANGTKLRESEHCTISLDTQQRLRGVTVDGLNSSIHSFCELDKEGTFTTHDTLNDTLDNAMMQHIGREQLYIQPDRRHYTLLPLSNLARQDLSRCSGDYTQLRPMVARFQPYSVPPSRPKSSLNRDSTLNCGHLTPPGYTSTNTLDCKSYTSLVQNHSSTPTKAVMSCPDKNMHQIV